jgi:predicted AAA+ superfamily ATPase
MKEVFKKILTEWQESNLPIVTKRSHEYDPNLDDILAIIGPRRAGKTYFMFQIIEELGVKEKQADFVFVNFEDYRLIGFKPEHFEDIIDAHYELYGTKPKYLFFDEIQNVREYGKVLRTFKDQGFKIVIS